MEPSESELTSISSSNNDPELGFQSAPSSPSPDHDAQTADLNHHTQTDTLHGELQNKLDLKEKEEESQNEQKVSSFDDGMEETDKAGAGEYDKGEGFEGDNEGWNGIESNEWNENVNESEFDKVGGNVDIVVGDEVEQDESSKTHQYPLRPEAEDCAFYLKTGNCKFGPNCKFNHPVKRKNQTVKENTWEREGSAQRNTQTECKFYLSSGGCKFGKACKYNHTRSRYSPAPILELNFLGLPIRVGEKECPYYMRNGSCKYGANCKFNHPDPTSVGGLDPPSVYGNGGSISLQGVSQPSIPAWSSPTALNESVPFMPMMITPTPGVSPHNSEWNGYQAPLYLSERSMRPPSTYVMNPAIETNVYMPHQKQMQVEEFPERPGEPECSYFLKTGDCKFKANCKFHHPKNRTARSPPCTLSDKGLPLRPDKNICTYYSRYGICKFGPACKFDHPIDPTPSVTPQIDQNSSFASIASEADGTAGNADASDATIQQPD